MDFDSLYDEYLTEFTVADAGIASTTDFEYKSDDTYAPGDARKPTVLGSTITRKGKIKKKKKKNKKKLNENISIEVYRGTTSHGNTNLGRQSTKIQDKLVATLGPNYTDNKEIAMIFKRGAGSGGKLFKKTVNGRVLELQNYSDVMHLYSKYGQQLSPGIKGKINNSEGQERLEYIQLAGKELRELLRSEGYMWVKCPFAVSDANYFKEKGHEGKIYIDLS